MADEIVVGSPEREIHVEALVQLQKIDISKQEENETEIFIRRAKLYRYHIDTEDGATWKERGIGDVKIMKHKTNGTYRLLMRRDKTLKICANHFLTSGMKIMPHASSDKALVWTTAADFADGTSSEETLCIKFGKPESATEFKEKFEECVKSEKNNQDNKDSDKLADELSTLKVKEEKDNNDNSEIKTDETNATIVNGTHKVEETSKDDDKPVDAEKNVDTEKKE